MKIILYLMSTYNTHGDFFYYQKDIVPKATSDYYRYHMQSFPVSTCANARLPLTARVTVGHVELVYERLGNGAEKSRRRLWRAVVVAAGHLTLRCLRADGAES